jgi:hypothetical protein
MLGKNEKLKTVKDVRTVEGRCGNSLTEGNCVVQLLMVKAALSQQT